jgi:hypothetical protein
MRLARANEVQANSLDSPNREAAEAAAVDRGIDTATIEVQEVTVRRGME